jgi:hypothetical protein
MNVSFVTKEELDIFKRELIQELIAQLQPNMETNWLKSREVRAQLQCSDSTLQRLRIKGEIEYKQIGGTYYYKIP